MSSPFVCKAHLKTKGVNPKCFPVDVIKMENARTHSRNEEINRFIKSEKYKTRIRKTPK